MNKGDCKDLIENLGKFLIKYKNKYSQDMSKKLKEKYDTYTISCATSRIEVLIKFMLKDSDIK